MVVTAVLKKNLTYIISGFGFILFLLSLQYFFDEVLLDKARAVIDHKPTPLAPKQNGTYVLLGMTMDAGTDAWQGGYQLKQAYDKYVNDGGMPYEFDPEKHSSYGRLQVNNALRLIKAGRKHQGWCDYRTHQTCFGFYQQHRKQLPEIIAANKILLIRYRSLYEYAAFQDETAILSSFGLTDIHKLLHAKLWLLWQTEKNKALAMLANDINMWQRVAAGDVGFLHKMIAIAMLERDLRFYAELLNEASAKVSKSKALLAVKMPYGIDKFGFTPQFRREFQLAATQIGQFVSPNDPDAYASEDFIISNPIARHILFRENASMNSLFDVYQAQIKMAEQTPENFKAGIETYYLTLKKHDDIGVLDYFYNPIGKILLSISIPSYDSYVVKLHELEQLRRLVLLKQTIKQKKVAQADIEKLLAQSGKAQVDLFTGKPAHYNKEQKLLSFAPSLPERDPVKLGL